VLSAKMKKDQHSTVELQIASNTRCTTETLKIGLPTIMCVILLVNLADINRRLIRIESIAVEAQSKA
jgi:hypothetical protein